MCAELAKQSFVRSGLSLILLFLFALPQAVYAEDNAAAGHPEKTWAASPKGLSGSEVPRIGDAAANMFKGLLYCTAIFLLVSAVYKKIRPDNKLNNQCGIEIISRRQIGSITVLLVV